MDLKLYIWVHEWKAEDIIFNVSENIALYILRKNITFHVSGNIAFYVSEHVAGK